MNRHISSIDVALCIGVFIITVLLVALLSQSIAIDPANLTPTQIQATSTPISLDLYQGGDSRSVVD